MNLIQKLPSTVKFCHKIIPGRHICHRQSIAIGDIYNTHDIIILCLIECLRIHISACSYNTHNFSLNNALRLLRIFHLFTDCNLIALFHKPVQITIHRVIRNTAHRRTLL